MRKPLLQIVFLFTAFISNAQSALDSVLMDIEPLKKEVFNSRVYSITNNKKSKASPGSKTYQSHGMYHSTYLILNPDSTYVYYSIYEVGFDLSYGKWSRLNVDTFLLNWDRLKTFNCIKNEKEYKKFFDYSIPNPVQMTNWGIRKTSNKIQPLK